MKRKTFYQISLLLPYLALLAAVLFTLAKGLPFWETPTSPSFLTGIVLAFAFASIVWAPLYTWMVLVILFWGRGKSADEIRRMYLLSPILFGFAMGTPVLLVDLRSSMILLIWGFLRLANLQLIAPVFLEKYSLEEPFFVSVAWALMAAVCLAVGYAFVGIVLFVETAMKRGNLFKAEEI